jgi:hypothetical protein
MQNNFLPSVLCLAEASEKITFSSQIFPVKLGTLHHHAQAHKNYLKQFQYKANNSVKQVSNMESKKHLLEYIKQAAQMQYSMSKINVQKLGYQYAAANNLKYPHQSDKNKLYKYGVYVSLKKPESASLGW